MEKKRNRQSANDYLLFSFVRSFILCIETGKKDQYLRSPLTWEVKKFYPSYYKIGLEALERINQTFQVDFPERW